MMNNFFSGILKVVSLLFVSFVFGFLAAPFFARIYEMLTSSSLGGSFLDFTDVVGFLVALLFSCAFLVGFNRKVEQIVLGVFGVVIFLFFLLSDLRHIYFHIGVVLIGLALGWGIQKVVSKFRAKT